MNWSWISVFWSANSNMEGSLRNLTTKLIDGSFDSWMAWWNTSLSNTTFFLGSKSLFKASIAAFYDVPVTSKCMKMSCASGLVQWSSNALICESLSIPHAVKYNSKLYFHFFHHWAKLLSLSISKFATWVIFILVAIEVFLEW